MNGFIVGYDKNSGNYSFSTTNMSLKFEASIPTNFGDSDLTAATYVNKNGANTSLNESYNLYLPTRCPSVSSLDNYSINIYYIGSNNSTQGPFNIINDCTDGEPFVVSITKNGIVLPLSNPLYKKLCFTYADPLGLLDGSIIGDNPFDSSCGYFAILPASVAEINGHIRYGTDGEELINYLTSNNIPLGRLYYLYCGKNTDKNPTIQANLYDSSGDQLASSNLSPNVIAYSPGSANMSVTTVGNSENYQPYLNEGNIYASNIYGPDDGNLYPDYIADVNNNNEGIYFICPEGINSRNIQQRENWANMQSGVEITSTYDALKDSDPFFTEKYSWNYQITTKVSNDIGLESVNQYGQICGNNYTESLTYPMCWLWSSISNPSDYLFNQYGEYFVANISTSPTQWPQGYQAGSEYIPENSGEGYCPSPTILPGQTFKYVPWGTNGGYAYYQNDENTPNIFVTDQASIFIPAKSASYMGALLPIERGTPITQDPNISP